MKNMKKTITMIVSVVLIAVIAMAGTVAYLTVDPVKKGNVFSVGDVDILLKEEVAVDGEGATVDKTEDGAVYTGVMPGDYLKKEVSVENVGKSPAYVAVTVTINNANRINNAIDEFYEGKGYTAAEIQAIYDYIFDGFGINYAPRTAAGYAYNDARGIIDKFPSDKVLYVDFAKTTNVANDTYMIGVKNFFKSEQEKARPDAYSGFHPASKGYYTEFMGNYEIQYTYYMLLENKGDKVTLFNGLNVPIEFNKDQLAMFDGLTIDIEAAAIQADNITEADIALLSDTESAEDYKARVAFTLLRNKWLMTLPDTWDGTADTTWYNEERTVFELTTAEQFAGLTELVDDGNSFEGKTVKLDREIDLSSVLFEPIGSYRKDTAFKGTFDGQGYTIKNLSQNTWELNNGYYYGDLGLGLFGLVEDATIKNLVMDSADISGESGMVGIVAAAAYGDCTFENITVTNSNAADYQYYAGGIVGWASGDHKYINCNIDASTTIAAQWGDFDNSTGGVIGGAGGSAKIYLKDCNVACRIDAYNDVTSSYQWYAYRRCGMLIGNTSKTEIIDGTTYATAPQLTCENVTVTYGDWANYTYCEFAGTSWPYVRVQEGYSNSAYSNPRYGHPNDANGNVVVDDNHVHNEGEDHFILCEFDQLYGGGQGVYGGAAHDGVTVVYNNK